MTEQAEELARLRKIVESDRIAIETNVDLTQQIDEQAEEIARLNRIIRDNTQWYEAVRVKDEEIARLTEERNRLRTPENFDMALALDEIRELKAGVQAAAAAERERLFSLLCVGCEQKYPYEEIALDTWAHHVSPRVWRPCEAATLRAPGPPPEEPTP